MKETIVYILRSFAILIAGWIVFPANVAVAATGFNAFADTMDVAGAPVHPGTNHRLSVYVFLGTECPISANAISTLNALHRDLKDAPIDVFGVISDPTVTRKAASEFRKTYAVEFTLLFDATGDLAAALKPSKTPDAFLVDAAGNVIYDGRINDAYIAVGKPSQIIKSNDLKDAIDSALAGKAIASPHTTPVGCVFESVPKDSSASASLTYARDIAPIVNANCVNCHRPGEVAPFSLTTYTDVAKRAQMIADVTSSHYMPPWKPVAGSSAHFIGERTLSDVQIERISHWVSLGSPAGNTDDLPPPVVASSDWKLGVPDRVIKMTEPFAVPASGRDQYRAFVVSAEVPADSYIAGFEFRAGAPTVVHHCILYLDNSGKARELDAADPLPGYKSFGGPGFAPSGGLGGWAPGAQPYLLPDGVGKPIKKGADVVMQMHYHPDGKPHDDQSSVALYFQKKPVTQIVSSLMLGTRDIDIPAGESNYVRHASFTLPVAAKITGITPHMHLIGKSMTVTATEPNGTVVPMIKIADWDFRWQDQYQLAEPLDLPAGTKITLDATYNNSSRTNATPTTRRNASIVASKPPTKCASASSNSNPATPPTSARSAER